MKTTDFNTLPWSIVQVEKNPQTKTVNLNQRSRFHQKRKRHET
ncbi:MAG: hypothetical protein NTU44_07570 [Bacteroidetes bacterium]|nr:hypothetical protein [Bacteroidota bacterium]